MAAADRPVTLAAIAGAHGVRGEVRLKLFGEGAEALRAFSVFDAGARKLTLKSVRPANQGAVASFAEIADRSAAEALRGLVLHAQVDPATRPEDDEEWYDHQLVGLRAVSPDGVDLGEVAEVVHLPAQEVLAIRREGRPDALVPFVAEFVPEVDLEAGRVVVAPPPGLLDLDLTDG